MTMDHPNTEPPLYANQRHYCAIHQIKRYFTNRELLQVVTSNYYSILYYGSEIWHIPSLKVSLKKKLLSSSALALKACTKVNCDFVSFENIHKLNMRGTPDQMLLYKHSLLLFKLYNGGDTGFEWQKLNQLQILTSRQTRFSISRGDRLRVGINALANRLNVLNGRIPLSWLNLGMGTFKIKCKELFLKNS